MADSRSIHELWSALQLGLRIIFIAVAERFALLKGGTFKMCVLHCERIVRYLHSHGTKCKPELLYTILRFSDLCQRVLLFICS